MSELCTIAAAIEAGNATTLPPFIAKQIQNAPESFNDPRAGKIAMTVRAMKLAGEPINFATVAEKHPDLITFIVTELSNAALPMEEAEYYAKQCWEEYQTRRAKTIGAEMLQGLETSPKQAVTIIAAARVALDAVTSETDNGLPELIDAASFMVKPIVPPAELIEGILHRGSKLILGGGSKAFKTWNLLALAIAIAMGVNWMGRRTVKGKVLFLNFEIQPHAWQSRIIAVSKALNVGLQPGMIQLWNLRGYAADFKVLIPRIIQRCRGENFALIVLDPIYKLYGNIDENSAGNVALLLNSLETLATETGAAIAFGAHFAKGNASAKEAIDRISGSGVFARDPDSLLIFTKHESDDAFTVEPILRNFAPVEPFAVRWEYPLMILATDLDPSKLKQSGGRKAEHDPADLLAVLPSGGLENKAWQVVAEDAGISKRTFFRLRKTLEKAGKIHLSAVTGQWQPVLKK